ncbi:hypothetical protein [Halobacillus halophilus]|uniref:hypothetical protein n=1 Tax=Halobacillus halophilus TaxID=1570 RepID=UPI001CD618A1|nr:hypothetical protein [Halobacillus halophilus]MCA1009849.1 hypothetical protein [Halobacillus halophilus]
MDIVMIFLLLSTLTPFLFLKVRRLSLAVIQSLMLVGMWIYYFQAAFSVAPATFSLLWIIFYGGLLLSQVGWIMFIVYIVSSHGKYQKEFQ